MFSTTLGSRDTFLNNIYMSEERKKITFSIPRLSGNKMPVILTGLLLVASFLIGSLWTKVQYLEKGGVGVQGTTTTAGTNQQAAPQAVPTEDLTPKQVSVDDDPVLGDANAPVTLIEFSDYECPFCKRHFDDSYAQLKKEYIDTGKVKLVFRDLPLPFHEPMATTEAVAANCARSQGDDATYFKFHDEIFKRTTSNGNGLTKEKIYAISDDLGLDTAALTTCIDDTKNADEVKKDLADANTVGASGTPTFFIGKSTSDGVITGTKLVGAQPFSAFKAEIDKNL